MPDGTTASQATPLAASGDGAATPGTPAAPDAGRFPTASVDREALWAACRRVAQEIGAEVGPRPDDDVAEGAASAQRHPIVEVAARAGLRARRVALDAGWHTADGGALVGLRRQDGGGGEPVALIPGALGAYEVVAADGASERVTASVADTLWGAAYELYRPLPKTPASIVELVRFGLRGNEREVGFALLSGLAGGLLSLAPPVALGLLYDRVLPTSDATMLTAIIGVLAACGLGAAAFQLTLSTSMLRLQGKATVTTRAAVWDRLLRLPLPFFRRFSAGDLAVRANAAGQLRQVLSHTVTSSALAAAFSGVHVIVLLLVSPSLTAKVLPLAVVPVVLYAAAFRAQVRHEENRVDVRAHLSGRLQQILRGIAKLRVAHAEERVFSLWRNAFLQQRRHRFRSQHVDNLLRAFEAAYPALGLLVLFALAPAMHAGGEMSTGGLLPFYASYTALLAAVVRLRAPARQLAQSLPSLETGRPILDALPEASPEPQAAPVLQGRVALHDVTFRYPGSGRPAVEDVTVHAAPGEFVAFVGPSGSGKSTLLRLLLGFESPDAGAVTYDDIRLADASVVGVRRQLGVVLQDARPSSGTLFENIAGASMLTLDEAWAAAQAAGLEADIRAMPMQMHTHVGEGGGTLSGGQRQRLMLARALARTPNILLLDEATSALDNQTQDRVSRRLRDLGVTRIVVAHRLSTIRHADRIYVLDGGHVVQEGTCSTLLADANGLFAQLARRQQFA